MSNNSSLADNQQVSRRISNEYLAGFIDGEGCFYVGFSKRPDLPGKWQIITEFHVSQNPGGKNVLEALVNRLGCGYLKPNHPKSNDDRSWVLVVKNRDDLRTKVIPFFKQYSLHTSKQQDFQIFKLVLDYIEIQEHLKPEGFRKIVELVFSNNRQTKKRYSKSMLLSS